MMIKANEPPIAHSSMIDLARYQTILRIIPFITAMDRGTVYFREIVDRSYVSSNEDEKAVSINAINRIARFGKRQGSIFIPRFSCGTKKEEEA